MRLHQLKKTTLRKRTRWGRGFTRGKNAGRGIKGQKSRSGVSHAHTFEGGRTPLKRMLPKNKGMKSLHTKRAAVNLGDLNGFAKDSVVTVRDVRAARLVPSNTQWLKILAGGELNHALTVHAHAIAAAAEKKLQAAGGKFHAIAVPSKLTKKQRERLAKKATA